MKNKKWYQESEMLVALSAIFISICALVATIYEANLERQNQLLSVWPRIIIQTNTGDHEYSISAVNKGLGPALIKTAKVTVDGKEANSWQEIFKELGVSDDYSQNSNELSSSIISRDEAVPAIEIKSAKVGKKLREESKRIDVEICYCSVYDDCWLVSKSEQYKPVEQCAILKNLAEGRSLF